MKPSTSISLVLALLALAVAAASAVDPMAGGAAATSIDPLAAGAAGEQDAATYLIYVDPAPPGVPCQTHQLNILAAALGGEEKAKAAMVYNYKNVVSGFSAKLTPAELELVKQQPQVNRVEPSKTLSLMSSNFEGVS
ncbi:hypothetical protein ACP70R_025806 [Stipagrostis hirtigluma subsp. patula]